MLSSTRRALLRGGFVVSRNLSSSKTISPSEFLDSRGYLGEVKDGMLKAFGGNPSIRELEKMGTAGLDALAKAVQREMEENRKDDEKADVPVVISVPHDRVEFTLAGKEGSTFLTLAKKHDALGSYLECACGGIAACSTCHIIVDPGQFASLPSPEDAELDMLDLTEGVTATSRLGCQVKLAPREDKEPLRVQLPSSFRNLF